MSIGSDLPIQLLLFAIKLIPLVFVSAVILNFLVEVGATGRASHIVAPIFRVCHLPDELSVPFIAVPLQPRVGHAMLASMLERGVVREREIIIVTLATSPLITVLFSTPSYYIPVVFPALGSTVATFFVIFMLICSSAKLVVGMIYGRVTSRNNRQPAERCARGTPLREGAERVSKRDALKAALKRAAMMTEKVAVRTLIVVALLALANYFNAFELAEKVLESLLDFTGLPARSVAITATYAVSSLAGITLAGAMLAQAEITYKEALLGLLLGSILFRLISEYPKHSFPFYASVYPARFAFKLVAISIAIDMPVLTVLILAVSIFM